MSEIASASINTLPSERQAGFESPSEQLIVLTYAQLQDLIKEAVEQAIQPLQDEIEELRSDREKDRAEFERFKATHRTFAVQTTKDIEAIFEATIEATAKPQPLQKDRGDILRALIAANGGKMLAKDARQKMHLGKEQFSLLLSKMEEYVGTKPFHQDRRKLVLFIK
jgi:FtsZ-binding cell division protein ZapB